MKNTISGCIAGLLLLTGLSISVQAQEVQILSAVVKDKAIDGAEVILQKIGETSVKTATNASGKASFNKAFGGVDDANMTLIVKKAGYSNLVVKCPCDGLTYAISPIMTNLDGLRIVLDWGANPSDMDSHLYSQDGHVYYLKRQGHRANLDVDDVDGFGPETITIEEKPPGRKYLYAVHNFTEGDRKGTTSISTISKAKAFVYVGSTLVRTFYPPRSKIGNTWVVFGIGDNGEFYDINKFADFSNREQVGTFMGSIIASGNFESIPDVSSDQKELANSLNKQGEAEYHKKNYADSEMLYLDAINNNPEHSQAYSNLGLLYQKMGKKAEGLFANRKAIALASGDTRKTVQASSYFNIAKIYEDEQNWQEALKNYEAAQALRDHNAYKKGIEKMKEKIGK